MCEVYSLCCSCCTSGEFSHTRETQIHIELSRRTHSSHRNFDRRKKISELLAAVWREQLGIVKSEGYRERDLEQAICSSFKLKMPRGSCCVSNTQHSSSQYFLQQDESDASILTFLQGHLSPEVILVYFFPWFFQLFHCKVVLKVVGSKRNTVQAAKFPTFSSFCTVVLGSPSLFQEEYFSFQHWFQLFPSGISAFSSSKSSQNLVNNRQFLKEPASKFCRHLTVVFLCVLSGNCSDFCDEQTCLADSTKSVNALLFLQFIRWFCFSGGFLTFTLLSMCLHAQYLLVP